MRFDRARGREVPDRPVEGTSSSPQRDTFLAALSGEISQHYRDELSTAIVPGSSDGPTMLRVSRLQTDAEPIHRAVGCDMARHGWRFIWSGGQQHGQCIGPVGNLRLAAIAIADSLGVRTGA